MRRALALSLLFIVALASSVLGSEAARLQGKIVDATTKQPIPDAKVTIEAVEGKNYKAEHKAKKDGTYALMVLTGTIKYKLTFSAPGYQPYEETMKLKMAEMNKKDVELAKGGSATTTVVPGEELKMTVDPAVVLFNEGAELANNGKDAEALAKFEQAVATKADLVAGWSAIAKLSLRTKNPKRAIEAANKVLEADPEETTMYAVLAEAYNATGDKAKAAEFRKKLPADAATLYNDAATLINAGKDGEAEALLKQAIAADEAFAQAYYELGMVYVRTGKNADARKNLQKYLELEPNGKDAATAKEMLQYVK